MRWSTRLVVFAVACRMFLPAAAFAQGSVTGAVRDATGALLPGVTVEASSPALIEKVRSVVTDGTGQYRIVDLRPGTYTVTFTLYGFSPFKREGIQLTGSFTATVDADLKVGSVAETVTVTGESPIVDVQSTVQERVMAKDVIDSIPVGRGQADLAVLVPGMTSGAQDVGGQGTLALSGVAIHDGRATDQRQMVDGLTIRNVAGPGQTTNFIPDVGSSQEVTIDYAAGSAEAITGGVIFNFIPREGGNSFQGSFFGTATNSSFQGSNFTTGLQNLGLKAPNHLKDLHDYNPSVGGPLIKNALWFFSSARWQANRSYISGLWNNLNAGDLNAWTYNPDLSTQTNGSLTNNSVNTRVTWQVSPRNKVNVYYENQARSWQFASAGISPESEQNWEFPRLRTGTITWSSPISNRLLLDVRGAIHGEDIRDFWPTSPSDPFRSLIGIVEQGGLIPGLRYRGRANANDTSIAANDIITSNTSELRASLSYVTGAHALKLGVSNLWGNQVYYSYDTSTPYNFRFLNGVPNQITERQNQYEGLTGGVRSELALYAQDRWTIKRLTIGPGVRFDYAYTGWNGFHLGPAPLVPNRSIDFPDEPWYKFKDISPRLSLAYDVFGNGKTAVKVNAGRYELAVDPTSGNPISNQLVNRVTRIWTDRTSPGSPTYYVPNCDILNPQANGDCAKISDLRFGTPIPSTTYNPAILAGWNARPNNWEFSTSVQHEVVSGVGIDVGYFRRLYGNFVVTDNLALSASDFTAYSFTTPVDSRLPDGGGSLLTGLRDLNPDKVGQVNNYVTAADSLGGETEHFDGLDFSANIRTHGALLRGGVSTGRVTQDTCGIVTSHPEVTVLTTIGAVQSTTMCHIQTPFLTQAKLLATYEIPKIDVDVAVTFQSLPGPLIAANFLATNALVQPSLGRPLSSGVNATVNIVTPGTLYGERLNQLDLRFTKALRFGRGRVRVNLDAYNALNGNAIRSINVNYGSWLTPTAILDPRLYKISVQLDF
jgi:hypothetical protein